ncbi:MAG: Crp/Fnr family transcriptional regulator [Polaromonas sp.]|uniref:Crp/Fnr family transcriptional regulator n=1 Tax=Polaromonas sp. TaxID=1869339 RepID=UPI002717D049|nr:Crp/Fnr family transcriptional regulator [Polaromonas sp.]MDO9113156.1 Crp/Fnr family transcriptional regulator [Polaromonas sp.]
MTLAGGALARDYNRGSTFPHGFPAPGSGMEKQSSPNETDFIGQLPESERTLLERHAIRKRYPRSTIIHSPGDLGMMVHFVLSGRVKIYNLSACGKEIIYRFCTSNSFFGIAEIFGGGEREVFAEAMEDTEVLCTDKQYFENLILRNPALTLTVMRILGNRVRQAHKAIQGFVFCDVRTRLAQLLIKLAQINGVESGDGTITLRHRFTHQEMANMIGAIRQTVTENINHFKRNGYIKVAGERIILTDPTSLRQLIDT